MGLRDTLQSAAVTALSAIGDLAVSVNYKQHVIIGGTFTPSAGVTKTFSVHKRLKAVVAEYSKEEIDGATIRRDDRKFLMAQTSLSFTPQAGDEIEVDTDTWRIVAASIDAAEALWTLQARRVN